MSCKGLSLMSGGLDSQLAVKILQRAGAEVEAVMFVSPFFKDDGTAAKAAEALGVKLRRIDFTDDIIALIKNPPHGFGGAMNPCIDCHAKMISRAGELMTELGDSDGTVTSDGSPFPGRVSTIYRSNTMEFDGREIVAYEYTNRYFMHDCWLHEIILGFSLLVIAIVSSVFISLKNHYDNKLFCDMEDYRKCLMPLLGASLLWGVGFTSYTAFVGHLGEDAV